MQVTTRTSSTSRSVPLQGIRNRLWMVAILAGLAATLVDRLIAVIATPLVNAPTNYPSFSLFPIFVGCMGGAVGAYVVFIALKRYTKQPIRMFYRVSIGVLLLSFSLPIMPLLIPLPRFAGVNIGIAGALMFIHTVTASIIVTLLSRYGRDLPK